MNYYYIVKIYFILRRNCLIQNIIRINILMILTSCFFILLFFFRRIIRFLVLWFPLSTLYGVLSHLQRSCDAVQFEVQAARITNGFSCRDKFLLLCNVAIHLNDIDFRYYYSSKWYYRYNYCGAETSYTIKYNLRILMLYSFIQYKKTSIPVQTVEINITEVIFIYA